MHKLFTLLVLFSLAVTLTKAYYPVEKDSSTVQERGIGYTYGGGPILANVEVYNLFWSNSVPNQVELDSYTSSIVGSTYITTLSEYNAGSYSVGAGTFSGSHVIGSSLTTLTDQDIMDTLNSLITAQTIPAPSTNTLYMIYIDSATTVTMSVLGGGTSCTEWCGIHGYFNTTSGTPFESYFGVVAQCASGCGNGTVLEVTTAISSHEIVEGMTDPSYSTLGWTSNVSGASEICDPCNDAYYKSNTDGQVWNLSQWYSINAGACITPSSNSPSSSTSSTSSSASSISSAWLHLM